MNEIMELGIILIVSWFVLGATILLVNHWYNKKLKGWWHNNWILLTAIFLMCLMIAGKTQFNLLFIFIICYLTGGVFAWVLSKLLQYYNIDMRKELKR